jgi:uncharacterized membrane protein YidH (DUF202 family)
MTEMDRNQPERYYRAYQRTAVVCLLFAVAVGGFFLAVVSGVLSDGAGQGAALSLVVLFAVAFLSVPVVTLRGCLWRRSDPQAQLVLRDEWTRRNWNRACRVGFGVVMWAQLPLAFLIDRLASRPSLSVMAGLSMALGAGAFWATYLYVGRQPADE